jgi:hypothetical protein
MSDLAAALMVAIRVHAAQVDKQGEPYLLHVWRLVEAVDGECAKVLAALHDVLEGGPRDLDLEDWEMFPENAMWIANSVEVLTRGPNETYAEYIEGIRAGHSSTWAAEIREVKIADLKDNLGRIPPEPNRRRSESAHDGWLRDWLGLKRRYERALTSLERSQR